MTNSQVQQTAINTLKQILGDSTGKTTRNVVVAVAVSTNTDPPVVRPIDVSQADPLDLLKVTISIPYEDVRRINLPMITGASWLQAESTWLSLKNLPYPTTIPAPPQG